MSDGAGNPSIQRLEREVRALQQEKQDLDGKLREKLDQWALAACPLKLGDEVVVSQLPHLGKKIRIDRVFAHGGGNEFGWVWAVAGFVLTDGGDATKMRAHVTSADHLPLRSLHS